MNRLFAIPFLAIVLHFFACKNQRMKEFEIATDTLSVVIHSPVYAGVNTTLQEIPLNMDSIGDNLKINPRIIHFAYLENISIDFDTNKWSKKLEHMDFSYYNSIRNPLKVATFRISEQQSQEINVVKNNDVGDFFQDNSLFLLTNLSFKEPDSSSFEMKVTMKFRLKSEKL